jgi:gamma-D-glutamyl-L-lysine dipeptidyl-peptidase
VLVVMLAALTGLAVGVCLVGTAAAQASDPARRPVAAGDAARAASRRAAEVRWIAVSVATLWVKPHDTRPLDAPSLAVPAGPRAWVASMSVGQKRWLVGRLETQALLGDKVYVLGTSGSWSHVAVAGQATPRETLGYPGWLPTAQLTRRAPERTQGVATVTAPTAWLWKSAALRERLAEVSYGTRLPVHGATAGSVEVTTPAGAHAYVARAAVVLRARGSQTLPPTGAQVVAEARRFLGLQYLWAGTSGFGFDCSGFTSSVFRVLGVAIPRDAGPQSTFGRAVRRRSSLRAGDLVFFRNAEGDVHHVGICVGGDRMIQSPRTGSPVDEVSLAAEPYASEFAGGRRLTR